MRVLMLTWEYPPHVVGGLGRHVMHLAPALAAAGAEVHVITPMLRPAPAAEVTPDGVRVHRAEAPPLAGEMLIASAQQANAALAALAREVRRESGPFDLVHGHDWLVAGAAVELKHAWRRPLIATIHATERGRQQGYLAAGHAEDVNSIEWWLTYESWRVITCSRFMAAQVQEYFTTPADKVDVVPNGVETLDSPFAAPAERGAFRRRFAEDGEPLVLYVGRLVFEKGVHVLLDAWPLVLAELPAARLLVAGTGSRLEPLRAHAQALGLGARVEFTGFIPDGDRNRLYHAADAAVFPSIYEPFGIVALEAMAAGCPVVVSDAGGLAEVVADGVTGLVAPPADPAALAQVLLAALREPGAAQARADAALREARERYSWERIAALTAEVYGRTRDAWRKSPWGEG